MDVSVIIVTYNSVWEKLELTLISSVRQKNISLQIIIADDGSESVYHKEIEQLMLKYKFYNYKIISKSVNQGTVLNIANGLKYADGFYTKTIAPGDYFYDELSLYKWCKFMKDNHIKVSFGNAIFYRKFNLMEFIKIKGSPVNKYLYHQNQKRNKIFVDYIVANDTILGAAQMMETSLIKEYIQLISNKVIYAEDYMLRIMIFDGIKVCYYPSIVIMYEYGTGISTSQNDKWKKILQKDFEQTDNIILHRKAKSNIQKKYQKYLKVRKSRFNKWIKAFYFPKMVIFRLRMKFAKSLIPTGGSINAARWIISEKEVK